MRRHFIPVVALLLLVVLYYHRLALQDRILVGYDVLTYFYPNEQYAADALRAGRLPLWNPYLFTGVPFLANPQTAIFYPPNLLFLVMSVPRAYAYSLVVHVFLAAAFSYAFASTTLGLRRLPALVVAVVYSFGGFLGAQSGHLNQVQASTWLPLLLLLAEAAFRRRSARIALVGSIAVALQLLAGHLQEFYMSMVAVALFVAWLAGSELLSGGRTRVGLRAFRAAKGVVRWPGVKTGLGDLWGDVQPVRPDASATSGRAVGTLTESGARTASAFQRVAPVQGIGLVALMIGLGLAIGAVQLLPSYELTRESIRAGGLSYEDATSFSLPPWLLLRALLPAHGDPQPFSEWIGYVGVAALLLAAFSLFARAGHRYMVFFVIMSALAVFLALGQFNPAYPLVHEVMPGLKLFRVPARWLLLYTMALAVLAGIGTEILRGATRPGQRGPSPGAVPRSMSFVLLLGVVLLALTLLPNPKNALELPGMATAALWLAALVAASLVLALAAKRPGQLGPALAVLLVVGELFAAGRGLEASRVNIPEAYAELRPAVAHLLANPGIYRVLPFSEGTFDPGDTEQLKAMVGPVLAPEGVYDFLVAAKHKETLTPNLPLRFGIPSIDGYDGGVLPLKRYIELKSLFALAADNTPDGRLREQLAVVPDVALLSWLNVRFVLMDRLRDVWIDGVYFDLGISRPLPPDTALSLPDSSDLQVTTIGIVSHLRDGAALTDGASVARLSVTFHSGAVYTTTLRAGLDTAEGRYSAAVRDGRAAHGEARRAKSWRGESDAWDYVTTVRLPEADDVAGIDFVGGSESATFVLRGLSLIDDRRQLSYPVPIEPNLQLTHLGDVKIYENRGVLPRAFLSYRPVVMPTDKDVLAAMQGPEHDPRREVFLTSDEWRQAAGVSLRAPEGPVADRVELLEYQPERMRIRTSSPIDGLLVITDSFYPGWRATVDGRPAAILRVDHLFRGVALPAGDHEVTLTYEPASLHLGAVISLAGLATLAGGLLVVSRRPRGSKPDEQ